MYILTRWYRCDWTVKIVGIFTSIENAKKYIKAFIENYEIQYDSFQDEFKIHRCEVNPIEYFMEDNIYD